MPETAEQRSAGLDLYDWPHIVRDTIAQAIREAEQAARQEVEAEVLKVNEECETLNEKGEGLMMLASKIRGKK